MGLQPVKDFLSKAGKSLVGTALDVLGDQFKEYFYVDSIPDTTLMVRALKRTNGKGFNKGNDNIISNGSVVAVADGQCALIVDQGAVRDICAEPGEFVYDNSSEPSVFCGSLLPAIKDTVLEAWRRIQFGGTTAREQRVYYINTKLIKNNPFGTPRPIPFHITDNDINLSLDISVQCNGFYIYQIVNPVLFYQNVCSNTSGDYKREEIETAMRSEFNNALRPSLTKISPNCKHYADIGNYTLELCDALNETLASKWGAVYGIKIIDCSFNVINATEEDEKRIKEIQFKATNKDPGMAAATLVEAQAQAMQDAAKNPNGAINAFMGMGMVQNAGGGMNIAQLFQQSQQQQAAQAAAVPVAPATPVAPAAPAAPAPAANAWTCECGTSNTGKFCTECAKPKPAPAPAADGWTCECGAVNKGKFCQECGKPKPAEALLYRCDKCGWEPADPKNPPKFCPECGDPFDDKDVK